MGLLEDLKQLGAEAADEVRRVASADQLEQFRVKYLGTKGALKQALGRLKEVAKEQKPAAGQLANQVKDAVQGLYDSAKQRLGQPAATGPVIDVTLPGSPLRIGRPHIITQTINEIARSSARMGFAVAYGPEVEDEWHNFDRPEHPAEPPGPRPAGQLLHRPDDACCAARPPPCRFA